MDDAETFDDRYSLDGVTDKRAVTEIRFLDTLENAPANAADRSEAKDRSVLCWTEGTVQYIAGKSGVVAGRSCKDLFWGYEQLTVIRFDWNFDTSGMTNMCGMFDGCNALASLDLSGLDTSHVTDMSFMFDDCIALTSLDLSGLDTSHVTDMSSMFADSTALTSLNLSGWDTSRVTDMDSVFSGCESLEQLNLSGWDTSKVTNMSSMFFSCKSLERLNLSGWDTSGVENMKEMFYDCESLTEFNPCWLNTANADKSLMYLGTRWVQPAGSQCTGGAVRGI